MRVDKAQIFSVKWPPSAASFSVPHVQLGVEVVDHADRDRLGRGGNLQGAEFGRAMVRNDDVVQHL